MLHRGYYSNKQRSLSRQHEAPLRRVGDLIRLRRGEDEYYCRVEMCVGQYWRFRGSTADQNRKLSQEERLYSINTYACTVNVSTEIHPLGRTI